MCVHSLSLSFYQKVDKYFSDNLFGKYSIRTSEKDIDKYDITCSCLFTGPIERRFSQQKIQLNIQTVLSSSSCVYLTRNVY